MCPKVMRNVPRILLMGKNVARIMYSRCRVSQPSKPHADIFIILTCCNNNYIILMGKAKLRSEFFANKGSRLGCF